MKLRLLPLAAALLAAFCANAQVDSCSYTLKLYDNGGDGWNGARLEWKIKSTTVNYTLANTPSTKDSATYVIRVAENDTLNLRFVAGANDLEIAYKLFNKDNLPLFADGPLPDTGNVFRHITRCPNCPVPSGITEINTKAVTSKWGWKPLGSTGVYYVKYGPLAFDPDKSPIAGTTPDTVITLSGLKEKTNYDLYVGFICSGGDTSNMTGPYRFTTRWRNDVGIGGVKQPLSSCNLGTQEKIVVGIKNFGGDPQSLIPFKYQVNGVAAGIPLPDDGLYTNVIGKDSTAYIEFETKFDLSKPGEYTVIAWTDLAADSDSTNDTLKTVITSIPTIRNYPYTEKFEQWRGGWLVADSSARSSWQYGQPKGQVISYAPSASKAWVTNLSGNYNDKELSYLVSPCLDFSSVGADPEIQFSLNYNTESGADGLWLESSSDGGKTWAKVGKASTGTNWYNYATGTLTDTWSGDSKGWTFAANRLTGLAGKADCRLRFVFQSDAVTNLEGAGIDNIQITAPAAADLAAADASSLGAECGSTSDTVRIRITNNSAGPLTNFSVSYRFDNTPVLTEMVNQTILSRQTITYAFKTPVNSAGFGNHTVLAWVSLPTDGNRFNDTVSYAFSNGVGLPLTENFESGQLAPGWTTPTNNASIGASHNAPSTVLFSNLNTGNRRLDLVTPLAGRVAAADSLRFEYRFVNFANQGKDAKTLGPRDSLVVQVSADCDPAFTTIWKADSLSHKATASMTRISLGLGKYAGKAVKVRFRGYWGSGDYYLDLDNIGILTCPSFNLAPTLIPATTDKTKDGSITLKVSGGTPPYSYRWNNGFTTDNIYSLRTGVYAVTVTDALGCSTARTFSLGFRTGIEEWDQLSRLTLYPNPSSGNATLDVAFTNPVSQLVMEVFNAVGQRLQSQQADNFQQGTFDIRLDQQPAGLYFVRIRANGYQHIEKLILTR